MKREEHLIFCKACKNQAFDPNKGIICSLTNKIADFEDECESYLEDAEKKVTYSDENISIKDNSKRAKVIITVFWGICIISLFATISGYFEFELLTKINETGEFTDEEVNSNDLRQGIIGLLQSGLAIAAIILFLNWFRRAYANLHRIGIKHVEYSDSMAIWSFVIPVVNLFRPYKIAKEIAVETRNKISELKNDYSASHNNTIIGVWWGLFIISGIIGRIALKTLVKDDTLEQLITSTQVYLVSDFIDIFTAFATLMMIKQISKDETILYDSLQEIDTKRSA